MGVSSSSCTPLTEHPVCTDMDAWLTGMYAKVEGNDEKFLNDTRAALCECFDPLKHTKCRDKKWVCHAFDESFMSMVTNKYVPSNPAQKNMAARMAECNGWETYVSNISTSMMST